MEMLGNISNREADRRSTSIFLTAGQEISPDQWPRRHMHSKQFPTGKQLGSSWGALCGTPPPMVPRACTVFCCIYGTLLIDEDLKGESLKFVHLFFFFQGTESLQTLGLWSYWQTSSPIFPPQRATGFMQEPFYNLSFYSLAKYYKREYLFAIKKKQLWRQGLP